MMLANTHQIRRKISELGKLPGPSRSMGLQHRMMLPKIAPVRPIAAVPALVKSAQGSGRICR